MSVLERAIEEVVVDYATNKGVLYLKLNVLGRRGWPDRIFVANGRVLFVEFKAPGEEPRKLQEEIHARLRRARCPVAVVDSVESGIAAIEDLTSNNQDI